MRHRVAGRKLGRTTAHRQALLRNLSTALFDKERITTTLAKAKELRPFAEKLVSLSKRETLHARRLVLRQIQDKTVVSKLFDTLSARFAQRPGGYTRILKLGPRKGDHAEMAIIELVQAETAEKETSEAGRAGKTRKAKTAGRKKAKKVTAKAAEKKKSTKKSASRDAGKSKDAKASKKRSKSAKSTKKKKAKSS